ncbi:hypothetical protein M9Y10_020363 [Tritrichomonas musculus]|uniref:Uncharacterized protein n=1 Tax=Tritrichomonas musculus TaxID=1915356 RepID=A0ABR2HG30_9EUKA
MSREDEIQKKTKEFWNLQLKLNKFVGETETNLDPKLKSILKGIEIPDWFNSGIAFSPLVLAMDDYIQVLEDELVSSQEELKELYQNKKAKIKENETKYEKEIVDLHKQIDNVNNEIEQIKKDKNIKSNDQEFIQDQYQKYYETEIERCKEDIVHLQKEDQELADTIQAYLEEIEISTNQIVMACDEHKKNIQRSKVIKQQISDYALAKQIAQRSSEKILQRTEILQNAVNKLLSMKKDNDDTLLDLQKDQEDYAVIKDQYQKILLSIQTTQAKQEEVLSEMIKAVELTENSSADVQMYQFEIQMLETESERLNILIKDVEKNLNNMVSDFDKKALTYYNFVTDQINDRMNLLKSEQVKLLHEKDVIEQQIEISRQKGSVITTTVTAPDFLSSNSADHVLKLKDEFTRIIHQKEKVLKETDNIQTKIVKNKEKLLTSGHHKRKTVSKLQTRRQKIEVEISLMRSNLKAILQKNGMISEENEKVKCYINQIRKSSTFSMTQILQQKEESIQKIQALIETENKEHESNIQTVEQDISKFKLIAEHYSSEKQQNEKDHLSKSKHKNEIFQNSKQKVKYLQNIYQKNMDEMLKGQQLLKEAQDQIDFFANETNKLLKKERSQSSLMNNAKLDQVAIATDIERYREIEKKLDAEIENMKKKSFTKIDSKFDLVDDEVVSDPL